MARVLTVAAIAWPAFLYAGWHARASDQMPWLVASVYLTASHVCHQQPERSFQSADVQWPVCGRCSGLYLAAPLGALAAWRRRRAASRRDTWVLLAVAAAPTLATWSAEAAGLFDVSSAARAASAVPLGAAVAWAIVATARGGRAAIG